MSNTNTVRWPWVAVGFIMFVLLAGIAGRSDYEDAVREEAIYCEQVQRYKATGGQEGWPDYRELYNTMCVKDYIKT